MSRIIAVGLSPTLQKTITFKNLQIDSVNRSTGYRLDASGKAVNSARVLTQMSSGIVTSISPLGKENAGVFLELAAKDGLSIDWILVPSRVRYCYTLLENGSGRATELVVSEPVVKEGFASAAESLLELTDRYLASAEILLLAGSRPAFWPEDVYPRMCVLAREHGCPVMVDFHGKDLLATLERSVPEIIKINEEEFCGTFGYSFPLAGDELLRLLSARSAELGNTLVITRGAQDTFAASKGISFRLPVHRVTALNSIGCGDSFSAGFLYSWLDGRDLAAALEKAHWCALRNALNLRPGSILDPEAETEQLWTE
jgi:fructose-1-phosphate kinase PfkB-like protein